MAATPTHVSLAAGVVVDVHETLAIAERAGANTGDCRDWELERIVVAGDVLPDRYDKWTVFERERFRQTRLQARESLCDDLRRQKRYDKGLDVGLAAIAERAAAREHPLRGDARAPCRGQRRRGVPATGLGARSWDGRPAGRGDGLTVTTSYPWI
jgi:hypothetical protein